MSAYFTLDALSALMQVIMIDLVLAGDNAIVIGLAAAGLPKEQRTKVILIGIGAATALRIVFASVTAQLLSIVGLLLVGGLLLVWVAWKMWTELRAGHGEDADAVIAEAEANAKQKTFAQATWQIIVADVSMSLDNVLAVAGAARDYPYILIFGLVLSIGLMGLAANYIAGLLQRYRWIAYVGLAIIVYVALEMTWRGGVEVWPYIQNLLQPYLSK
jgi:YjbE family integral membrane protein